MCALTSLFSLSHAHLPRPLLPTPTPNPRPLSSRSRSRSRSNPTRSQQEEVEVKIKLPDSHSHKKLKTLLSPFLTTTHHQHNLFFDSPSSSLSSLRSALRLRFYNSDARAVLSLKSSPTLSLGVSRASELELDVDPLAARACVARPSLLAGLAHPNAVIERVREIVGEGERFGFEDWLCIGGFRNVRSVFDWKGLQLEVDETLFDFGTSYEVECESDEPFEAKRLIEEMLVENGIQFSYSKASKFAVFRAGKLL